MGRKGRTKSNTSFLPEAILPVLLLLFAGSRPLLALLLVLALVFRTAGALSLAAARVRVLSLLLLRTVLVSLWCVFWHLALVLGELWFGWREILAGWFLDSKLRSALVWPGKKSV